MIVPQKIRQDLARSANVAVRNALLVARETLRLQRMFDEAEIPALFVKGATLASLAYGSVSLKESRDIDLLTTPAAAITARRLLLSLGYEVVSPNELSEAQFATFARFSKEALLFNRSIPVALDLHWRLTDNKCLIPSITALSPTQRVQIGAETAQTLQKEALFAYLCVHGSLHGWSRLRWLADVNAFLAKCPGKIDFLYRTAIELGAGRTPATTLLLCQKLLGLALTQSLMSDLRRDAVTRALVANSLYCIAHPDATPSPYSIAGLRRLIALLFLSGERGYLRAELMKQWISADDRARIHLPRQLAFLYHLLRVPLWLSRVSSRLFDK